MRALLILRGAPGAGKSTWIKNHNLEQYTLEPDALRVLCSTRELRPDGSYIVAHNFETEQQTWKILFELLEYRMSRGEFTVIDATASKTKDIKQYKDLADKYRYRMYCVDFTDIPLEVCLQQNLQRPSYKWVPEEAIKNIYARFATQKVPTGVTVLKPDEFETILERPFDMSTFKKIVFIGDIHGCYDTLMQYFKDGIDSEVAYIFTGDYIDRGDQNVEILQWLHNISDQYSNVCLLEGNHERWIRDYGNDVVSKSREFEYKTKPQLVSGNFTPQQARMFYRKVRQMSHFTYHGLEILVTHGGIPCLPDSLIYLPTHDFIHGVGEYTEHNIIAETWMQKTSDNQFLVHGHRNTNCCEIQEADRVFNLEGKVEFGGKLRIVELTPDGTWSPIELDNIQPVILKTSKEITKVDTVEEAISYLRHSKFIQEKSLGNDISSFNFTREAFYKSNWNRQTILARGLFIDTAENKIIARSYEKFFRINELPQTDIGTLSSKLQFPVSVYRKENGYLGIVSYNYKSDSLFIATKSTITGPYVERFKTFLEPYTDNILTFVREQYKANSAVSLVFEVIDPENDPHIIKYEAGGYVVLLDVIYNTLDFKTYSFNELVDVANILGCPRKQRVVMLYEWEAFKSLYEKMQSVDFTLHDQYIEGYVFEDSTGFMVKQKSGYYLLWKKLRGVADQTLRCGYITKTGMLTSAIENYFYGFCKKCFEIDRNPETKLYPYKTDIISLRDKFETDTRL